MYYSITGHVHHLGGNQIAINCNEVSYEMHIPFSSLNALTEVKSGLTTAYTHLAVKEDSHTMYGFATSSERDCFRLLIQVSGVGPTTALTVLSAMSVMEVLNAIRREDVSAFKAIKGIGPKTAEQIILDLQKKVGGADTESEQYSSEHPDFFEAVQALVSLGYNKTSATKAVKAACGKADDLQGIVREAIKIAQ